MKNKLKWRKELLGREFRIIVSVMLAEILFAFIAGYYKIRIEIVVGVFIGSWFAAFNLYRNAEH